MGAIHSMAIGSLETVPWAILENRRSTAALGL
jgi:hypothetical protein